MTMLQGIGLTKSYGGFLAVDGVDIAVQAGRIHGLIGPNGAGKSTLIDILSGRGGAAGGRIVLNGTDITDRGPRERRLLGVSRSFQRTNIFPALTVEKQLDIAAWRLGASPQDVREIMDELSLTAIADVEAGNVSYGDQRSLDLALALVGRPSVLLLDEPASGLTSSESLKLGAHLRNIVGHWGVTVLIVEHDMEVIFEICDVITVLHLGRRLMEGTVAEVRSDHRVVEAYLGTAA